MKILRSICTVLPVLLLSSCMQRDALKAAGECYADYVNPFIGTDFTGNTYPGAQVPFGMVQLSPDNGLPGWDRISGYFLSRQYDCRFQSHPSLRYGGGRFV